MMRPIEHGAALLAMGALLVACPLVAQQREAPGAVLARATAALDSANIEQSAALLTRLLSEADGPVRARSLQLLAAIEWWSDARDSARVLLRASVASDPFVLADTLRFSPGLLETYRLARSETRILRVHVVSDTLLRPDSARWPVALAVGQAATVRWRLTKTGVADTTGWSALAVDSLAGLDVGLLTASGASIDAGSYQLVLQSSVRDSVIGERRVPIEITRTSVDTVSLPEALPDLAFLPEQRRGDPPRSSILRGILLAGLTVATPLLLANGGVGDGSLRSGALVVAGGLAIAGIAGASAGRPVVVLQENITHNRALRDAWQARLRATIVANDRARRFAPLRLHVGATP